MDELEILDDTALAKRWHKAEQEGITPEAIAKWIDRIANRKRAGHLKSFKGGNKRLFRIEDVKEFETQAKFSLMSLLNLTTHIDLAAIAELIDPPALVETKPKTRKVDEFDSSVVDWINDARKSKN